MYFIYPNIFFLEPPGADMARTSQGITHRHSTLPTYFLLRKRDKNNVKMFWVVVHLHITFKTVNYKPDEAPKHTVKMIHT